MDRNCYFSVGLSCIDSVALRKESVDRNIILPVLFWENLVSLSARRAWIEIFVPFDVIRPAIESLSARRAWIEIVTTHAQNHAPKSRSPQGERG